MTLGKIIQVCAIDATMEKLLKQLNIQSIEEGYQVICVCSEGNYTERLLEEGFNIININIARSIKPISNLKSIIEMYKLFSKEKPDIVHVHTPVAAILGRIAAKIAKVRCIIYTAHGFYFHENMKPMTYRVSLNIEKFMARYFTNFIFTQSEEDKITALENNFIDSDKMLTIGNGVDVLGKFNPDRISNDEILNLRRELKITEQDKIIAYVGRLVREKGIIDLLEGFIRLNRNDVKLIVVGDTFQGDRDNEIISLISNYKSYSNIIFTGARNDVNNILYLTDIFCLPSYREGMPRSIIEAMSMKCAVLATNIRGSREEVVDGETGYLVKLCNPEDINNKLSTMLDNECLLKMMKEAGRRRAEKFYNEKEVVKIQLDIYKKLLGNVEVNKNEFV